MNNLRQSQSAPVVDHFKQKQSTKLSTGFVDSKNGKFFSFWVLTSDRSLIKMRAYSLWYQIYSSLVQSVERWTVNPYVAGSSPAGGAKFLFWFSFRLSPFTNPKFVAKRI